MRLSFNCSAAALLLSCVIINGRVTVADDALAAISTDAHQVAKIDFKQLAADAVSENADTAQAAIEALREVGSAGWSALYAMNKEKIEQRVKEGATRSSEPDWQRLKMALDNVAGQRDSLSSHLFWYTDFDAAKKVAKATGKPILSLRMLGKLTDEFSCANSRFFRSTLYANEEIGRVLRDQYVLYWQSVRPVPKVTIDFGDGRKLERTLTGNSIHYILDSDGRVIDALPGLYGPKAFLRGLADARTEFVALNSLDEAVRTDALRKYHSDKSAATLAQWQGELQSLGLLAAEAKTPDRPTFSTVPTAAKAGAVAVPKYVVERPMVAAALADPKLLGEKTDDAVWARLAELHNADAELDQASKSFIASQNPTAGRAATLAFSKREVESPLVALFRNFQQTIAIDTVKNEYTFHQQIHQWLADPALSLDIPVNDLNDRVYAQLFLTPNNDPWLGLIPGNVYTALDDNGVCQK